jgi:FkbM family methyltransferase
MLRQILRRWLAASPLADGLFRRVIWSRVHFPEHELRVLNDLYGRPFDVAVDIGAALGSYTWVLNRKAKNVVAFEPGRFHFAHVNSASMWSRVKVINAAVGAAAGTANLITPAHTNDGRHMATLSTRNPVTNAPTATKYTVRVVTLDEFLDDIVSADRRVDLLKIDVEGFENAVLKGGMERVRRDLPVVIAEIEARHNPDYAVFFDTLLGLGYSCYGYRDGAYVRFTADEAGAQEGPDHFVGEAHHRAEGYVNNFVFEHPNSAAKVLPK